MRRIFYLLKQFIILNCQAINNLIKHDGVEHAGYMAFITLLSFFPFLVFLMAVTGFLGNSEHGRELINLILTNMPDELIRAIKPRIEEIMSGPPNGLLTISVLGMIWTSSSTLEGLRTILNKIYNIHTPPAYVLRRMLSIAQFFLITAMIVISMFIFVFIPIIYQEMSNFQYLHPVFEITKYLQDTIVTPIWDNVRQFTFIICLFMGVIFLYYTIPNVTLRMRSLIPGAILVSLLWTASGSLLSIYVYKFSQVNLVYGSLAGFVITLLFFYIINLIFIHGAEFNYLIEQARKNREI